MVNVNRDQGTGIVDRLVYAAVTTMVVRYGPRFGFTTEDVAWLAGGIIAGGGSVMEWYRSRPVNLLNRAAAVIPENAALVISTPAAAPVAEKSAARDLANAASDKVIAQTS